MADVDETPHKRSSNLLNHFLESIENESDTLTESWTGIAFFVVLYFICVIIQTPENVRGIIAQLESIITIILVLRFPRKGFLIGVLLIIINIVFIAVIVFISHNLNAITGIVVALLNLVSICIIGTLVNLRFAQIKRFNVELEQRVKERTKELAAANREMEAFSYSVSHDLRSPLRTINGFCKIILDDYQDQMNPDFKEYFNKIRAASLHMGHLIDELLKLSQISRTQLNLVEVNLSEEFQKIFDSLQSSDPEREVTLSMPKEINVIADKDLISIAL
ncbi:MAG: hypothetical protein LWX83_09170, partial [Anaerolineae bacterium]|nr:hypothetical protein [Anaerolineae bacterium]